MNIQVEPTAVTLNERDGTGLSVWLVALTVEHPGGKVRRSDVPELDAKAKPNLSRRRLRAMAGTGEGGRQGAALGALQA